MSLNTKLTRYIFLLLALIALNSCTEVTTETIIKPTASRYHTSLTETGARKSNSLRVMSFNILAPCWASSVYYPASTAPSLNRLMRRQTIIDLLKNNQSTVDVFTLQEVSQIEFNYIKEALSLTHIGFQANHSPSYWSNWITSDIPWELNGNAIFVKKDRFSNLTFEDFPASGSGNHAALFTGTIKNADGRTVRIASVHLDSDHAYNRKNEMSAVLAKWLPLNNSTDIIAGDFNTETDATNIQSDLKKAGYFDLLEILGKVEQTHPWTSKYYGADNWGIIDHIVSRGSTPVDGSVMNFNLFNLYPNDEEMRINRNLQLSGSDHFPVTGTMSY